MALLLREVEKTSTFTQKWLVHLLLMMSYLITTATDHHWTCLKMCARDERTATENARCWCFIPKEKTQENRMGGSTPHPRPVRPSVKSQFYFNSHKEVVTEGFFLSSFFACKICNHRPQNKKTNILPLSYGGTGSLSPLPSPPPPTHLIIIVEVTKLGLPLPGEGILPIMVYTGRPRLKGV